MSDQLDQLLAEEHRITTAELRQLDSRQLREIEDAAAGRVRAPHRVRALALHAAIHGTRAIPLLAEVLRDPDEDTAIRAAAAAQLGRTNAGATSQLVDALLAENDPSVVAACVGALARVGSPDALEPLDRAAGRDAPWSHTRFAATVVAFRARRPGYEPRIADYGDQLELPERGRTALVAHGLAGADSEAALTDLRLDDYGVSLDPHLVGIDCVRERYAVALALTIGAAGAQLDEHLLAGPLLAGLVGWRSPADAPSPPGG